MPYSEEMIEAASADLLAQADPDGDHEALLARYPKAAVGDFDGDPMRYLTEMDAMIAYLQILGRMVDFTVQDRRHPAGRGAPMLNEIYSTSPMSPFGRSGA